MNHSPQDREILRQRMDACRLGSDDLSLPEMAGLADALQNDAALRGEWESRQRSERLIAAGMHDLPVPAGLAEQILAAVAASHGQRLATAAEQATTTVADSNGSVDVRPVQRRRLLSRRSWSWIGGIALLIVAGILIRQVWFTSPTHVTREELAVHAQEWFRAAVEQPGNPQAGQAPIPFPRAALSLPSLSWRKTPTAEEPSLVAFDLTPVPNKGSIYLLATRTSKKYEVLGVPYTRLNASGGLQIGAWQQGDLLYVVVVDQRSGQQLENVVRTAGFAWAIPRQRSL